jgi:hypothetical protein
MSNFWGALHQNTPRAHQCALHARRTQYRVRVPGRRGGHKPSGAVGGPFLQPYPQPEASANRPIATHRETPLMHARPFTFPTLGEGAHLTLQKYNAEHFYTLFEKVSTKKSTSHKHHSSFFKIFEKICS